MLTMGMPLVIVPINSTVIAHAGDGNFHTCILFDPNIEEHRREAERLNQFMVYTALSMDGTYSSSGMNLVHLFFIWTMNDQATCNMNLVCVLLSMVVHNIIVHICS
jgi:hypothetical protein